MTDPLSDEIARPEREPGTATRVPYDGIVLEALGTLADLTRGSGVGSDTVTAGSTL